MNKQIIIAVSREFGSGGHVIAEALSQRFGIPLYDNNLLEAIAEENALDHDELKKYDEKPKIKLFSRTYNGHSTSMSDHIVKMQFRFLQEKADKGESFVIVGRCAEHYLSHNKNLISIFILGNQDAKIRRVKEVYGLHSLEEAAVMAKKKDWERKTYHNYNCKGKWGDSRNYHLSVNSSLLGIEKTTDILEAYIKERIKLFQ